MEGKGLEVGWSIRKMALGLINVLKVTTGEHYSVTSKLVCVNFFDDSVSTFLTILCQHF